MVWSQGPSCSNNKARARGVSAGRPPNRYAVLCTEEEYVKTVAEQLDEFLKVAQPLEALDVELADAMGCILAENVVATVDVPHTDLAALDGYAVRADETFGAEPARPVHFPVTDDIFAVTTDRIAHTPGAAARIASGARMPTGADAVVPLIDTDHGEAQVDITARVAPGENVRAQGEDLRAGTTILEEGTRIGARHIALLAAAGRDRVRVRPAPRVVVMSVGDELVAPGKALGNGKIYDANSHALATAVRNAGAVAYRVPAVSDDRHLLRESLEDQLLRADVILTTGGLSYGGGDTLKEVLSPLGSMRFDAVAMNPGRHVGVGTIGGDVANSALMFCLPGNPVAALVCFEVFVRPSLRKMAGYKHVTPRSIRARAARGLLSRPGVQDYVRVQVYGDPRAGYEFDPVGDVELLSLANFAKSNGLAVVPADKESVGIGDELECMILNG